jgi:hypothetical protein
MVAIVNGLSVFLNGAQECGCDNEMNKKINRIDYQKFLLCLDFGLSVRKIAR